MPLQPTAPGSSSRSLIVGIDLAGSERRGTGFCSMDQNLRCETKVLYTDGEITGETTARRPEVVIIDAPLFLPKGRESLDVRGPPHLRACDRVLLEMRIKFFPISLGPMRMLTKRGMRLRKVFEDLGLRVIESFPGAVQDLLGMPRKQEGLEKLRRSLIRYGVSGQITREKLTGDELDAITCAVVGKIFLEGDHLGIGDPEEGLMILPKRVSKDTRRPIISER